MKLGIKFSDGPISFEHAPFVRSKHKFIRCPHGVPKKNKVSESANEEEKKRFRKGIRRYTTCEAEIRLIEYKVYTTYRVPENASKAEKSEAIQDARGDPDAYELYTVVHNLATYSHNHQIVAQKSAISIEDMEYLNDLSNIGVIGDSNLTTQLNYQARLGTTVAPTFDRQTVANKRRKMEDRKVGLEGDMKKVKETLAEEEMQKKDNLVFVRYPTEDQEIPEFGFLYQSGFMKHLLSVYGNMTVYLDATHNICDLPHISLFILAVRTNCSFQPVAVWLSNSEEGDNIAEYLQMLKDENPGWRPQFAMCDNCGAEFNGFLKVFPADRSTKYEGVKCLICTFHVAQAWRRWVYKSDNDVHPNRREFELHLLRDIMYAEDWLKMEQRIKKLRKEASPQVKKYFDENYEPVIRRWTLCCRTRRIDKSNTNNGVEVMNRIFKQLEKGKGKVTPVPETIKLLLKEFLRNKEEQYNRWNLSNEDTMMDPHDDTPVYMAEAPKLLWEHYVKEKKRRLKYDQEGKRKSKVYKIAEEVFLVSSSHRSEPHKLNIRGPTCTCRSFTRTHFPCRHIFQAIDDGLVKWEDLPDDYRNIPFFSKDTGNSPGMWPANVEKSAEYPHTEDEDENEDEDEDEDVMSGQDGRAKKRKERDIDFKGDWKEMTNKLTACVNDPGFSEIDPEQRDLMLQRFKDSLKDLEKVVYKRNFDFN